MTYIPPLASAGIGSGLNVNDIVAKMMSLEERPLMLLKAKVGSTETKLSAFGQIKSALSALYDAASGLTHPATWRARHTSSSDSTVASVTAADGSSSTAQFDLQVKALAQGQALASGHFPSGDIMEVNGDLVLQTGRWAGNNFTPAAQEEALHIHVAWNDKLADVADKITQAGSAHGISAIIVKDGEGERLMVRNSHTGADNGFTLNVEGEEGLAGSNLSALAYNPSTLADHSAGMQRTTEAADAEFSINGMQVTSASNTVADVLPGITLTLHKTSSSTVAIDSSSDTQAIHDKIKAFQTAVNQVVGLLRNLSAYDQQSKSGKPLQGDSTVRQLQSALAGLVQRPGAGGVTLASLGLEMKLDSEHRNPSVVLDEGKLKAAMSDLPRLEKLLTGDGEHEGLITRIRDFAFAANGVQGNIATRTKGLQSIQKNTEAAMDAMQLRLEQRQANLLRQYQALDAKMATLGSLNAFLTAQVGQWNKK